MQQDRELMLFILVIKVYGIPGRNCGKLGLSLSCSWKCRSNVGVFLRNIIADNVCSDSPKLNDSNVRNSNETCAKLKTQDMKVNRTSKVKIREGLEGGKLSVAEDVVVRHLLHLLGG